MRQSKKKNEDFEALGASCPPAGGFEVHTLLKMMHFKR